MEREKTWRVMDQLLEVMEADYLLTEICKALSADDVGEALEYVARQHEINIEDEDEEEEDF